MDIRVHNKASEIFWNGFEKSLSKALAKIPEDEREMFYRKLSHEIDNIVPIFIKSSPKDKEKT